MRLTRLVFNVGVVVGMALTGAGAWLAFGASVALLSLGLMVWGSTIAATCIAVAAGRG